MNDKDDLSKYYAINIENYTKCIALHNDYDVDDYFDEMEIHSEERDDNNSQFDWSWCSNENIVYFNSLAAVYDFNLIFGTERVIVKTRALYGGDSKIIDWLYEKFGTDSTLEYIFWDGSFDCGAPNWRWRHIREYTEKTGSGYGQVIEFAFSNKADALQFKLVWG